MTFVLTPLSHCNSITEPHAHFLLSLLEDLTIDFPSHFITSIIDVYMDTVTRDKLIFPLTIIWILRHFSIPIPDSPLYIVIGAISATFARQSEAQLQPKRLRTETTDSPAPSIPSTSTPSSLAGGVTLETIMV